MLVNLSVLRFLRIPSVRRCRSARGRPAALRRGMHVSSGSLVDVDESARLLNRWGWDGWRGGNTGSRWLCNARRGQVLPLSEGSTGCFSMRVRVYHAGGAYVAGAAI